MRILFVNHTARVSGAERSLLELMRRANSTSTVTLACPEGELMRRAQEAGIDTFPIAFPQFGFASSVRRSLEAAIRVVGAGLELRRRARKLEVDVIHAGAVRSGLAFAFCVFSKPERVVDVRDVLPQSGKASLVRLVIRFSADTIVFNSRFTRDRFGSTAPATSDIAYPPIDLTHLVDLPLASDREQGTPTLGIIGQITPWKGQDDAIRILAALRERFPSLTLRIVGSPVFDGDAVSFDNAAFRRQLATLAVDLGVADAVDFIGESEDVGGELAQLDCLLAPSWAEPFGRVVAEGMAAGVPVVATSVGGPSELIVNGVSGFLAPPRDFAEWISPVAAVLEDHDLARRIADQARERVKRLLDAEVSDTGDGRRRRQKRKHVPGRRAADEMNLVLVCRRYWPATGGVESFLRDMARELGRRHSVTVLAHRIDNGPTERLTDSLTPPPSFEPFFDGPARIEPIRVSNARRAAMTPLVAQVIPGARRYAYGRMRLPLAALYSRVLSPEIERMGSAADLIHMWGGDLVASAAMESARRLRVPGVITPFAHPNQYGTGPVDASAYRMADRIVALLDADADIYEGLGVRRDRIEVCGVCSPGVSTGHGEEIRARFDIAGPLVVFLGVRRPYKGFDLLLEAAPLVTNAVPDATFGFVGPGDPVPVVDGVRIVDAGFASDIERGGWLKAADVVCLPSEAEIFPLTAVEAWSAGTPVVMSDLPPLVELLAKTGGGIAVPREPSAVASALIDLLSNPDRARSLGEAGLSFWRSRLTVDAVADRYEQMYAALIAERTS
jgi:glycosyltransferase involved in cell wall biosynthesis